MDSILQMQVFFFISSIGFVVVTIFVSIFLYYLIRATNTFSRILEQMEKDINSMGDTTKEILDEIRDSALFSFFLGKKRKSRKNK